MTTARTLGTGIAGILGLLAGTLLAGCSDDAPATSCDGGCDPTEDAGTAPGDGGASDAGSTTPGDGGSGRDGGVPTATSCAPLPPPAGATIMVTPAQAADLPRIVREAAEGTTILLADGVYRTSGDESARRIQVTARGITIRSASGDPEAVVIDGEYATAETITIHARDVTLAELTVTHAVDHCVHVSPRDGGPDVTGTHLYRVRVLDCGEQFVKINPSGARDAWVDDGVVECSHFEMTDAGRPHVERAVGGCYTGGIDAHSARGWIVRQNVFEGIYCAGEGLAEHAIHFWSASRDTLVERNVIRDCARGIGFGLVENGGTRPYPDDPYPGIYVGHLGGIIRNNVIVATIPWYDTGIELDQARDSLVLHNSIIETDGATGRFSSIDARFANTRVIIRNNLVRRLTVRNDAQTTSDHNVENVPLAYFADGAGGDAHLTSAATEAIDRGAVEAEAGLDIDGEPHGDAPDLGADER